jgi:hypothetical protein
MSGAASISPFESAILTVAPAEKPVPKATV